jgi:hypothetical protein
MELSDWRTQLLGSSLINLITFQMTFRALYIFTSKQKAIDAFPSDIVVILDVVDVPFQETGPYPVNIHDLDCTHLYNRILFRLNAEGMVPSMHYVHWGLHAMDKVLRNYVQRDKTKPFTLACCTALPDARITKANLSLMPHYFINFRPGEIDLPKILRTALDRLRWYNTHQGIYPIIKPKDIPAFLVPQTAHLKRRDELSFLFNFIFSYRQGNDALCFFREQELALVIARIHVYLNQLAHSPHVTFKPEEVPAIVSEQNLGRQVGAMIQLDFAVLTFVLEQRFTQRLDRLLFDPNLPKTVNTLFAREPLLDDVFHLWRIEMQRYDKDVFTTRYPNATVPAHPSLPSIAEIAKRIANTPHFTRI